VAVEEAERAVLGVAVDRELPLVELSMVGGAQADEVRRDRHPPVVPVHDVVDVQPSGLRAQRVGASLVPALDHAAEMARHRAGGGRDPDELPGSVGGDDDLGVAPQVARDRVGHDGTEVELAWAE
jgi:hypothetical protein